MQNGQGNQKQSIQSSDTQSFINTTLVRSLNRLMNLETPELSAVCEAKGSLVMGKAVSEDMDVQELEAELKELQAAKAPTQKIAETTSKLKEAKQEAYEFGQFLYQDRLKKLKTAQEKQNPILVDSWIIQPMALRFSETQYAKKLNLNQDNLEMSLTVINEFKVGDKIQPAFPKEALNKHTSQMQALIHNGEINYPSHHEISEDLEMHERTKLIVDRQLMTDKLVQYI